MMKYLMMLLMLVFPTVGNAAAVNDGPNDTYHSLSDNTEARAPVYGWQKVPTPMGNAASRSFSLNGAASGTPINPNQDFPEE